MIFFLLFNLGLNGFAEKLSQQELLPLESLIEEDDLKGLIEKSIIVKTNQGRFAVNNPKSTSSGSVLYGIIGEKADKFSSKNPNSTSSESTFPGKRMTVNEMLAKTSHDPTGALKKAWVRGTINHVSLFMRFSDGKCEEMEWYPVKGSLNVLGEHPAGEASLRYDVRDDYCANVHSFISIPGSTINLSGWIDNAMKLYSQKEQADLARVHENELNEHVTRRQIYAAFLKEAHRFKDEQKYSCTSFINNAFRIATDQQFIDPDILVTGIQMAEAKRLKKTPFIQGVYADDE